MYFVFTMTEDGDCIVDQYGSKNSLLQELNDCLIEEKDFFSKFSDKVLTPGVDIGKFIIEGELVIPKKKIVVTEVDL